MGGILSYQAPIAMKSKFIAEPAEVWMEARQWLDYCLLSMVLCWIEGHVRLPQLSSYWCAIRLKQFDDDVFGEVDRQLLATCPLGVYALNVTGLI